MSIWNSQFELKEMNKIGAGTMGDFLDMKFTEIGENYLKATMPVSPKTVQPMRLLHGGASVALAETLGSVASWLVMDTTKYKAAVGIEINANHMKSAKEGEIVTGIATPLKLGRTIHVWDIKIFNEKEEMVCVSRLTTMLLAI